MSIAVLLADDHKIMREGVRSLIGTGNGLEVVAEAADGREAVRMAAEKGPDLVLMDLNMPVMNGIEATRLIKAEAPAIAVLVLTMALDSASVLSALDAGANGYLSKHCGFEELKSAMLTVAAGKSYFSEKVTELLIKERAAKAGSAAGGGATLTRREQEVLRLIAEGCNTKDIAFKLSLSGKTIESHRLHIMKKLNMTSLAELTKYAVREGLSPLW